MLLMAVFRLRCVAEGWAALVAVFAAGLYAPSVHAQFPTSSTFDLSPSLQVNEPDSAALRDLERVSAFLEDEQWDEAVESLRRLQQTEGERVVELAPRRYATLQRYIHAQIARMPPSAIVLYRKRTDPLAEIWLREGIDNRDSGLLEQVVETTFCSSFGDDALLALGEMHLERGNYLAARDCWERISPQLKSVDGRPLWLANLGADSDADWELIVEGLVSRTEPPEWLAYPDTELNLADLRARLVLVSILEGSLRRARWELELLRRLHPDATGIMGGRQVNYAEHLSRLIDSTSRWPVPATDRNWPTFAGSVERTKVARDAPPLRPAWQAPIALDKGFDPSHDNGFPVGGRRIAEDSDGLLSNHPVIAGDLLLFRTLNAIFAYDLQTGAPAWGSEKGGQIFGDEDSRSPQFGRSTLGVPRFTLTVHDGKLVARMGEPVTTWPPDLLDSATGENYLVVCNLEAEGSLLKKIELEGAGAGWSFEGSPVCDEENLYVAIKRSDVRPQAYVACFDLRTGVQKWQTFVCAAETPARGQHSEVTHNLLTLVDGTLFYNTNLGAVAALSVSDGTIAWIHRYERATKGDLSSRTAHLYRDLNPCVYDRGILLAAPTDSEAIIALDPTTGAMLWATADHVDDVVHLLGVLDNRLIASGDRLWWIDLFSGKAKYHWPESPTSGIDAQGRGVLAGGQIYFPTREKIFVFDGDGRPREPILLKPLRATGGNLIVGQRHLIIATANKIFGFSHGPPPRDNSPPRSAEAAGELEPVRK